MQYLNANYIRRISVWARIVGSITMIYGVVSIVIGMLTYYVHIIPGFITIVLGKLLFDIGLEAKKALLSKEESIGVVEKVLSKFSSFLVLLGILIIITILFYIAFFIFIS